ncbi:MAG: hypothetical protein Q7V15_05215 [Phenylobacterium sp.]|uniref:hypothetical protein n=1 Tax=Phenylobacterium sp. TaxID=1871053 RepID=UPI0027231F25|nr:hypothetical protein [Phenylobacterium sp.]MDO8900738.1 hypothetical protein [Phenylobacterium sp.]MDP2214724.1 hypothetical protein [Phenylobacterium sp.]
MSTGAVPLTIGLALQACATPAPPPFGPISETQRHGYREQPHGEGAYTLLAVAPFNASAADARAVWERRAEELCPAGVSKRIIFRADKRESMGAAHYIEGGAGIASRSTQAFEVEGYVYCEANPGLDG